MTADPWPDLYSQRKSLAFDALDSGEPCVPIEPACDIAVLRNTLCSVLTSSPTPDQAMLAFMLYTIGPLSAAEASRLIGRRCSAHQELVALGAARCVGGGDIGRHSKVRLEGSWAVSTLPGLSRSPRPPSVAELRALLSWARDFAKRSRAEADSELFAMLRWVKQSCAGSAAKPTPKAELLKGAAVRKSIEQLKDWSQRSEDAELPVPKSNDVVVRWLSWAVEEHTALPEFIPAWPSNAEDKKKP